MLEGDGARPGPDGSQAYPLRLQKFLARAGVASRRGSENLMTAGRVKVNGEVVSRLGSKVDPLRDTVEVDGMRVVWGSQSVYILLNKPAGYVSTMSDPQGRPCVADLAPVEAYPGLYPVGRLDRQTRGLMLFTTDGEMGNGLLHPSHHVEKTYLALVSGFPEEGQIALLREGIVLDDGPCAPAAVDLVRRDPDATLLNIRIHEGRYRQVRRMCAAIGHECLDLQRVAFGPLSLGDLAEGQWREASQGERQALSALVEKAC